MSRATPEENDLEATHELLGEIVDQLKSIQAIARRHEERAERELSKSVKRAMRRGRHPLAPDVDNRDRVAAGMTESQILRAAAARLAQSCERGLAGEMVDAAHDILDAMVQIWGAYFVTTSIGVGPRKPRGTPHPHTQGKMP